MSFYSFINRALVFYIIDISGRKPSDFPIKSLDISGVSGNLAKAGNAREIASLMIQQTVPLFKKPLVKYTLLICIVQFGMFAS